MKTIINKLLAFSVVLCLAGCSFLNDNVPQATLSEEEVRDPKQIDNMVISAYAIFISAEDINSSFSMWNFDVRSDDAYKGGNGESDGDVFHQLEISRGILTTNWNINDMWSRLYNCLSRVNAAIDVLLEMDDSYKLKQQRLGEMYFLRAYGHFLLKRLYKNIPFVVTPNMSPDEYNTISNTAYTNNEGWGVIITDLENAYKVLPTTQEDKGRPTKAAAAALMAKTYLWKGNRHVDYGENSVITLDKTLFATATAGQKLIVKYTTDAEKEIELKVMNEHFDHLAGSREQVKLNGNGRFEHFLTPKAVEELKAYGLEIGGNGFNALRVELVDGKASLPEGVNVWTGYFWADDWNTMYIYWNGYRYVDFNDVKAIRFYHQANRSDFVLNVRDNWVGDGGVEIANIGAMTAGEGYMELPLTDYMREKIAASEHLLIQFNKEGGAAFNVTDIVLVMEEPYTRTVTNGNYGTICLPRASSVIEGATMYSIVGGNASEGITIEEVASMEAGKPYIFQASADQLTVTMTGARADVQAANGLVGNLGETAMDVPKDGHSYVLSTNLLYLVDGDVTIAPNRAYINMDAITPVTPVQGAKRRVIATYNQATGIEDASATFGGSKKIFENGVLYIIRDGVKYNATGVRVQ